MRFFWQSCTSAVLQTSTLSCDSADSDKVLQNLSALGFWTLRGVILPREPELPTQTGFVSLYSRSSISIVLAHIKHTSSLTSTPSSMHSGHRFASISSSNVPIVFFLHKENDRKKTPSLEIYLRRTHPRPQPVITRKLFYAYWFTADVLFDTSPERPFTLYF